MKLCDIYRASDVTRWQIVKTAKHQSVAEHSFMVAMITRRLANAIFDQNQNEEKRIAVEYALWHDLPEVFTGDMATPIKNYIRSNTTPVEGVTDVFTAVEMDLAGPEFQEISGTAHMAYPDAVAVVKLADIMEGIKFLDQNALTRQGQIIKNRMVDAVGRLIDIFAKNWPGYQWSKAWDIMEELRNHDETYLDDLL